MSTSVLFVSGYHRSGTTLVTSAATAACGGTTLTAGHIARHVPSLARFLARAATADRRPDRGVDRLAVSESTPEEYGWLLHHLTGRYEVTDDAAPILHKLVAELGGPTVVLKNPWDTGREDQLLRAFPDARFLLVRRGFAGLQDSVARAFERYATSSGYLRALVGDRAKAAELLAVFMDPARRAALTAESQARVRREASVWAASAERLPLTQVAYLSYDELRADPVAGAAWASHLLDAPAFAGAVAEQTFPESRQGAEGDEATRTLDSLFETVWAEGRRRQAEAGLLPA